MACEYKDSDGILIDAVIESLHDMKLKEKLLDRREDLPLAKAIHLHIILLYIHITTRNH
jgi:hypothetical protein